MGKREPEQPLQLPGMRPATDRPCYRCAEYEATRFGRAQVLDGERGLKWVDLGLCPRCAVWCAGPSAGSQSALGW